MKTKEYNVMSRAVEEGIRSGLYRAFKHYDESTPVDEDRELDRIVSVVANITMESIQEVFNLEGEM
jgi:hypothetical protein